MKYNVIYEDLFEVDESYDLAHCISYDCKMGAGIARTFDEKFPEMKPKIQEYLYVNNKGYPCSVGYVYNNRIIFNLITKERYFRKPTYSTITEALKDLKKHMIQLNRTKVAMPCIGCGLDKLDWDEVRYIIKNVFNDTDIEILICVRK